MTGTTRSTGSRSTSGSGRTRDDPAGRRVPRARPPLSRPLLELDPRPDGLGDLRMQGLSFEELVARTRADDRVVGLFLGGSRGKGANVRPDSDYDVRLVVTAPVPELDRPRGEHVDVGVMRLDRFRAYPEWDRYTLTRTQSAHRQDGRDPARDRRERPVVGGGDEVDPAARAGRLHELSLPRAQASSGHRRAAARSRVRRPPPHVPLRPRGPRAAVPRLPGVGARPTTRFAGWDDLPGLLDGDPHELFRRVEAHVRERGLGDVVDSWEPDVAFMRGDT